MSLRRSGTYFPCPIRFFALAQLNNVILIVEACNTMMKSTSPHSWSWYLLWGKVCSWHLNVEFRKISIFKVVVRFYNTISTIFQLHYGLRILHRSSEIKWKEHELWSQTDLGIRIPAPTFTSCVTLGKSVYLSVSSSVKWGK